MDYRDGNITRLTAFLNLSWTAAEFVQGCLMSIQMYSGKKCETQ